MIDRIIRTIINLRRRSIGSIWNSNKIGILIYEKNNYRRQLLRSQIQSLDQNQYYVILVKRKLDFLIHSKGAKVIYSYGLSKYVDTRNLRLLFLGQTGDRIPSEEKSYKTVSASNYATPYIASYLIAGILAYERKLLQNAHLNSTRKWDQEPYLSDDIRTIEELKIGIIGVGNIGRKVATYFRNLGSQIHVFDVKEERTNDFKYKYTEVNWHNMLEIIDYLVITINNENNDNFIGEEAFAKMNKNLCIVNVSRGFVIDEGILKKHLNSGSIRGAILDVFRSEPLQKRHPFWKLNQVHVTPHIAGNIQIVFPQIINQFIDEIRQLGV